MYVSYVPRAPNPYQDSVSQPVRDLSKQDLHLSKQEIRNGWCEQILSICLDKTTFLYPIIQMVVMKINHVYHTETVDTIQKYPGLICNQLIRTLYECGKYLDTSIKDISEILSIVGDDINETQFRSLRLSCEEVNTLWENIDLWYNSYHCFDFEQTVYKLNNIIERMYGYIYCYQSFAGLYNSMKIDVNGLNAFSLINQFVFSFQQK